MNYKGKVILAPMVRISGLPMRLLSLKYGADLVYCEEIIDFKILNTKRIINEAWNTVDYVLSNDTAVFRTCAQEKGKLILQLGTGDAQRALQAAKKVEQDIDGIDVNMGCPKEFSVQGGMGAALLKDPERAKEILTALVKGLSVPVTCKMRLLPTLEETIEFVKMVESTGVSAIAIHGRTKEERPRHANHNDQIRAVAEAVNIPVIANGGSQNIKNYSDIQNFKKITGASSVMLARAAQWNPSVFNKSGPVDLREVIIEFIKNCIDLNNHYTNTKYCIQQMMHECLESWPEGQKTLGTRCKEELYAVWGMMGYFKEVEAKTKQKHENILPDIQISAIKRRKTEDGKILIELPVRFIKKDYPSTKSPKLKLNEWTARNRIKKAVYESTEREGDRQFHSVVTCEGKKYTNNCWSKSKQMAEHAAAIVCLVVLGEDDGRRKDIVTEVDIVAKKWKEFLEIGTNAEPHVGCENKHSQNIDRIVPKRERRESETDDSTEACEIRSSNNDHRNSNEDTSLCCGPGQSNNLSDNSICSAEKDVYCDSTISTICSTTYANNTIKCDNSCLSDSSKCDTSCLSNSSKCDNSCLSDSSKCDNSCFSDSSKCDDSCLSVDEIVTSVNQNTEELST